MQNTLEILSTYRFPEAFEYLRCMDPRGRLMLQIRMLDWLYAQTRGEDVHCSRNDPEWLVLITNYILPSFVDELVLVKSKADGFSKVVCPS